MYGFFTNSKGEKIKILILKLKEGSWFGDFEIMMETPAEFHFEAFKVEKPLIRLNSSMMMKLKN